MARKQCLPYKTNIPTAISTMAIKPPSATLFLELLEFESGAEPVGADPEPVVDTLFPEEEPVEVVMNPEDVADALLETLFIVSKPSGIW